MENMQGGLGELLDRAIEYSELKDVDREGWVLRGVEDGESVADHSWGTAQLCLLFAPYAMADPRLPRLDPHRAVSMALVHDLAEVQVGDIPRRMDQAEGATTPEEKSSLETAAIMRLTTIEGDEESAPAAVSLLLVRDLWQEYEESTSSSARFVRDMNLIDMCLQAFVYERDRRYDESSSAAGFPDYPRMDEFFETSRSRCTTTLGRHLHRMVESRYRAVVRAGQENRTV
jgi:putative hydrolase of HD superfamily